MKGPQGDIVNVFHISPTAGWASEDDDDFLSDVRHVMSTIFADIASHLWGGIAPTDITVSKVHFDSAGVEHIDRYIGTTDWDTGIFDPSSGGEVLPSGNAALLNLYTSGLRTVGRKYLGVFCENQTTDGYVSSTLLSAIATFAAKLLIAQVMPSNTANGVFFGVHSKRASAFLQFLRAVPNAVMAYQRRRRLGHGS
jgi:hypothetical protein